MRRASIVSALLTAGVAATACSGHKDEPAAANSNVAPGGFVPPTALNRTDFVDMLDKRFTQLDLNHDSILQASEIPERHHDRILSFDANHDGEITLDEFEKGGLARFDKADRNKDRVLTGDERRAALGSDTDDNAANVTAPANGD